MTDIRIRPTTGTWTVRAGGAVIGETNAALELSEGNKKPVIYFPRGDVAMALLEPSDHSSQCQQKGDAAYFSIVSKSRTYENAVWSYETPNDVASAIKDHLAFEEQEGVTVEQV